MRFRKIKLTNIRSYKQQEIEFPTGSILLAGEVGSGKTTVLLAIEYALFGLQPGQKGNSLLRNGEDVGEVSLEMDVSGHRVVIDRRLKRTPKGVSNEFAAITVDGERWESSVTEIKSKVVELLGYPPEFVKRNNVLYKYTVHAAQEQMKQIILEDAESRINILRHVFGIDRYRQIGSNLSILVTELKSEIKILQAEISSLEMDRAAILERKQHVMSLESLRGRYQKDLEEKISRRKELESELRDLEQKTDEKRKIETEIEKTKLLLSAKRETLNSLTRDLEDLDQALSSAGEPVNEAVYSGLVERLRELRKEEDSANAKYLEAMTKLRTLERESSDLVAKKERIFRIDICPTCLQDVGENHKHNILNETEQRIVEIKRASSQVNEEITSIAASLEILRTNINDSEKRRSDIEILRAKQEQLSRMRKKYADIEKQQELIRKDQALLLSHADSLKERLLSFSPLDAQHKKKRVEVDLAFLEERRSEIARAELEKEIELGNREILLSEESLAKKERSKVRLHEITELTDWLTTSFSTLIELIERNVLLKLRKEFSFLFQKWFSLLIPDNSLDSHIDENFTPIILQGETEMDYQFLSGGERTAVALAYRLALNQTINSVLSKINTRGLIILDEPTDGFSDTQITKMRDILEELNAEQLVIVSHEQKIESFVDNVFRVSKEGDLSSIDILSSSSPPELVDQKT